MVINDTGYETTISFTHSKTRLAKQVKVDMVSPMSVRTDTEPCFSLVNHSNGKPLFNGAAFDIDECRVLAALNHWELWEDGAPLDFD